jgi:light-independent protochlorophyllide reductase subunit B
VRALSGPVVERTPLAGRRPLCNVLGPTALGFRHKDDVREILGLLARLGVDVNVVAPLDATPADLGRLGRADFNVVLYPEIANAAALWLEKNHGQPFTKVIPIGVGATRDFIAEVAALAGLDAGELASDPAARSPWYSRSVDSTYLTGKRVFIFGDATHAIAAARIAATEMGFTVVGLGTYSREFAREVRAAAKLYGVEALITDDYLEVEAKVAELQPELVLGSQMDRHIAKRLGIPCAVISAPVHVQDFPARYSPQMGFEGANVLFDTWIHPLMMGLEEHLLAMFRDDPEFHDGAAPSHLGKGSVSGATHSHSASSEQGPALSGRGASPLREAATGMPVLEREPAAEAATPRIPEPATQPGLWAEDAEKELRKIPFFVRGKARRNTERFAAERGLTLITVDTLYDAKAHFGR